MVWIEKCIIAELGDPIDALAMNKNRSLLAAAGRSGLRIYSVGSNKFEMKMQLRKARKMSMHFSLGLTWSVLKENLLASSLLNGAVLIWDLENQSAYPDRQYKSHKQAVTKVCFSESNENLLISGSKEGTVLLYDIRAPEPSLTFSNKEIPIRDLLFCLEPKMQDVFVTADDSGSVRFWDMKRPDRAFKEFIAHTGYVSSIALNPQTQSKNLIATAGRDKFIRVWDLSKQSPERLYTIETMAPLTRIFWCADNAWHIASCSTANDNNIHIWDIRRPYLPFASFSSHTDHVTDMCWPRYGSGDRFVSAGKDGRLILHFMDQAIRPLKYANSVSLSYASSFDGIVVALPERKRLSNCNVADMFDPFRRSIPSVMYCATPLQSNTGLIHSKTISFLAKNYKLVGATVEKLCAINAGVAERAGKTCEQLAFSWRTVALLCADTELATGNINTVRSSQFLMARNSFFKLGTSQAFMSMDVKRETEMVNDGGIRISNDNVIGTSNNNRSNSANDAGDGNESDDESEESTSTGCETGIIIKENARLEKRRRRIAGTTLISGSLSQIVQNTINTDFFFGVNELNLYGMTNELNNDFGNLHNGIENSSLQISSNRQPLNYSSDILKIKDEAFDFRSFRHHYQHQHFNTGNVIPFAQCNLSHNTMLHHCHNINRHQTHYNSNYSYRTPMTNTSSSSIDIERSGDEDHYSHSHNHSHMICDVENDVVSDENEIKGAKFFNDDFANNVCVGEMDSGGEIVDLIDDCIVDPGDPISPTCLSSATSSVSADEVELNSTGVRLSGGNLFWDSLPRVKSILEYFSNMGDVQTCAAFCLVLGEKLIELKLIKAAQVEAWFFGYLELLERLELWNAAASFIKICYRPRINQLSNESTFVKVVCTNCKSVSLKSTSRCRNCGKPLNARCIVCEQLVRGVWSACSECGHGGHIEHMREWFAEFSFCSYLGCNCLCSKSSANRKNWAHLRPSYSMTPPSQLPAFIKTKL